VAIYHHTAQFLIPVNSLFWADGHTGRFLALLAGHWKIETIMTVGAEDLYPHCVRLAYAIMFGGAGGLTLLAAIAIGWIDE
jgi:hypothetical protein